jgi:hypothetical protein
MRCQIKYRMRGEELAYSFEFSTERMELDEVILRFREMLSPGAQPGVPAPEGDSPGSDASCADAEESLNRMLAYIKNECRVRSWFYRRLD